MLEEEPRANSAIFHQCLRKLLAMWCIRAILIFYAGGSHPPPSIVHAVFLTSKQIQMVSIGQDTQYEFH